MKKRADEKKAHRKQLPFVGKTRLFLHVLTHKEKRQVAIGLVIACFGIITVLITGYTDITVLRPKVGGSYTEATIGTPQRINPLYAQTNDVDLDITSLVFSGLMKKNADQNIVDDLAERHEISEDEKTYTFHLRKDVRWHTDTSEEGSDENNYLTADDVVFTLKAIQDPLYKSPLISLLSGAMVEKVDDYTVTITLAEPFAPFIESLTFGILPAYKWASVAPEAAALHDLNLKPIGTGPFKYKKFFKDKDGKVLSYQLERNENYYNDPPYIEKLEFIFYPTFELAAKAVSGKKSQGLSFVPKELQEQFKDSTTITLKTLHLPQYTALFFNQKRNEILQEDKVRQALAYALDRQRLVEEGYSGNATIINTPILPGYLGHNPKITGRNFDPENAKKMLDDAGWTLEEGDAYRNKGETELALTLTTVDESANITVANLVREMWEMVNVKVNLEIQPATIINSEVIKPRNYDILLYGQIIGTDPDPYPFWHSSQSETPGVNLTNFTNRQIDQLLVEARKTSDTEQRRLKYLHFQNILADEVPAIFLYNPTYTHAVANKIKGYALQRMTEPSDRFIDSNYWYIDQQRVLKWRNLP